MSHELLTVRGTFVTLDIPHFESYIYGPMVLMRLKHSLQFLQKDKRKKCPLLKTYLLISINLCQKKTKIFNL